MKCRKCKKREVTDEHYKFWKEKPLKTKEHRLVAKKHPEWFEKLCTICHARLHGSSPKKSELKRLVIMRDRAIAIKIALENQIRGFSRIEYLVPERWASELDGWKKEIKTYDKEIKKLMKLNGYDIWGWLKGIKGIAENTGAKLISYIDIENTPSIPALRRYCGLDPNYTKRRKNMSQEEVKRCGNPYIKKELVGVLADSFIKQRTPIYREVYDETKKKELERQDKDKPKSLGHAHNRAKRKMMKVFLNGLYHNWKEKDAKKRG